MARRELSFQLNAVLAIFMWHNQIESTHISQTKAQTHTHKYITERYWISVLCVCICEHFFYNIELSDGSSHLHSNGIAMFYAKKFQENGIKYMLSVSRETEKEVEYYIERPTTALW